MITYSKYTFDVDLASKGWWLKHEREDAKNSFTCFLSYKTCTRSLSRKCALYQTEKNPKTYFDKNVIIIVRAVIC